jgi:hypothetical protein
MPRLVQRLLIVMRLLMQQLQINFKEEIIPRERGKVWWPVWCRDSM